MGQIEQYDRRMSESLSAESGIPEDSASPEGRIAAVADSIVDLYLEDGDGARAHHLNLTKPPGSLGQLEALGVQLSAIAGTTIPPLAEPGAIAVFAGDHGVHAEGVSPWPQEVTAQMVLNFCAGGAAINVIARANDSSLLVVNAGVANPLPDHHLLRNTPVRLGTANLRLEPAMTRSQAAEAVMLGIETANELVAGGARCLMTGDMGIGNTTPSAAVIAAVTGKNPRQMTGRGTGIDDDTLDLKSKVIQDALIRLDETDYQSGDGLALLSEIGGLEIGAIAGLCLGGAALRVPVILDGVISVAGALLAQQIHPAVVGYLIAGHRSVEPAASAALTHLELEPILEMELRLGEGSGAALAYPMVRTAVRIMAEMATFESASIDSNDG